MTFIFFFSCPAPAPPAVWRWISRPWWLWPRWGWSRWWGRRAGRGRCPGTWVARSVMMVEVVMEATCPLTRSRVGGSHPDLSPTRIGTSVAVSCWSKLMVSVIMKNMRVIMEMRHDPWWWRILLDKLLFPCSSRWWWSAEPLDEKDPWGSKSFRGKMSTEPWGVNPKRGHSLSSASNQPIRPFDIRLKLTQFLNLISLSDVRN